MNKLVTISFLLISNFLLAQTASTFEKHQLIDSLLQESHRRGIFNGNALVSVDDEIIYHEAIGFSDASRAKALEKEMRFMIGSISKEFDGLGIMILKEQAKLSLDSRLSAFFPDLPSWAERIRIRHLLQYSSGLPSPDYNLVRTEDEVWNYLKQVGDLLFEPGTDYNYNNVDVFLRKRIIEKLSGKPYSEFVKKYMLAPCAMRSTVMDPTGETPRFTRSFDENYVEDDFDTYMSGWVGLTTEDMLKWVNCLNSGTLISKESLAELSESHTPSSQSPLGTSVYENGKLLFRYHHGQNDNFEAGVAWIPDPGYTIILLTNNRCNELGDHINAIDAILRGNEFKIPKRSIELSLRAKIFHEGLKEGMEFLKNIRKEQAHIYNFNQEEKELRNTGSWLLEKGKDTEGFYILEFNKSKFPKSVKAYLELATWYEKEGELEKALKNYHDASELDPENTLALTKIKELQR